MFGAIAGYPRMRSKFTFSLRAVAASAFGEVPQIQCRRWGGYAAGPACRGFSLATLWIAQDCKSPENLGFVPDARKQVPSENRVTNIRSRKAAE